MKQLTRSEKIALTKEINQTIDFIENLKEMKSKQGNKYRFMYLGDWYTQSNIDEQEQELKSLLIKRSQDSPVITKTMSKARKLQLLNLLKIDIKEHIKNRGDSYFMCIYIKDFLTNSEMKKYNKNGAALIDIKLLFPEIFNQRARNNSVWFNNNRERINAIEKQIQVLKNHSTIN